MKVLLIHNFYKQPGGEDRVFQQEGALLEERGHEVVRFTVHNKDIASLNKLRLVGATLWNGAVASEVRTIIERIRPAIVHCHNIFPLISPAIYYVANRLHVPVVQTLHNYRLLCPAAILYRDGAICEECLGSFAFFPSVRHGCYQGSRAASGVTAAMLATHRFRSTWTSKVDVYIALTEFARNKFIQGGLPADKIVVKPNFLHPATAIRDADGSYALFVGRLVPEKGVHILLDAWKRLGNKMALKVAGDGPLASSVSRMSKTIPGIEYLGSQSREQVASLMRKAQLLIIPSLWYEGFPMIIVEAYAVGLPIIASSLGSLSSLIIHGRTGRLFQAGDSDDLCTQVEWVLNNREELSHMRREVVKEFSEKYTAQRNYELLMEVYAKAGVRKSS